MKIIFKYRILIICFLVLVLISVGIIVLLKNKSEKLSYERCLLNDETATHEYENDKTGVVRGTVKIIVKDRKNEEKFSFQVENVSRAYHAIEMYKCNIYVIRVFNYEDKKGPLPNYRTELWRYHYDDSGEKLLVLFKKEEDPNNFGQDFRIDPTETYLVLERKYMGDTNFALVVKDLETLENIFILPLKDIFNKYPSSVGDLDLILWSKDGKYFWGRIFEGGYTNAFIRIETDTWQYEVFPKSALGGDAFNPSTAYVTSHSYRESPQGTEASLSLYNLLTKREIPITSAVVPLESIGDWGPPWFFKPKWLSDTELEYELPSGEKKIYKLSE